MGAYKLDYFRSQFSSLDNAYEVRHLLWSVYADDSRIFTFLGEAEALNILLLHIIIIFNYNDSLFY